MIIKRGILEILNLDFLPDGLEKKEIMVEHSVSIKFELSDYVKLEKGDFIIHDEKNFSLNKDFIPVINKSTNGFIYDLKFYDITERFKDFKLKFQLGTVDELDFKLTTSGDKFLDIVIYSLHKHGLGTFTKGQFPSEIKEIHFKNVDIFSGLNQIANEYELEWWIDGPILNLGKLEYGEPVLLRNDIELEDISFSPSSEKLITRLYAFGSSRNIPSNYRINESVGDISERRLRLPIGTEYVDLFPDLPENKVVEGVHVFEDIYPRQKNTIIDVLTKDVSGTVIYTFKSDNTFTITHDDIIAGKPLKIAFQSGLLAGKEFDLIIRDNNYFEIRYEQSGDVYLPNMTLKPQVGDEFFFFNFKADNVLPVLITQAENELLTQAQNFLDKIGSEYVYTTKNRSIHCEENGIDLDVGQVVTLQSETIGSVTSRIRGYEKKLYNKFECDYSIGSYSKYSRIDKIEKETGSKADKTEISEIGGKVESVSRDIQNMDLKFLSKISVDTSKEVITFLKGIIAAGTSEFVNLIATGKITAENIDVNNTLVTDILCVLTQATLQDVILKGQINSETFTSGFLGDGFRLNKIGERWTLEIDDLVIRKTMTIYELIVQRVIHRDGWVLHSPAGAVLTNVTDGGTYWRCEHDGAVDFITGSQVFCQNFNVGSRKQNPDGSATFNGVSVKKYWRKVTSFGAGWFNLSKTDMEEGSEMPGIGDHVAVLGHKTNPYWQNAILIASTGSSSPYLAHYAGINSYSLAGKEVVREGNLSGVVDDVFGQLSGYGLYANNVFLRGIFKLVNGTDIGHKLSEHDTTFLSTASKTEVSTAKSEAISTAASDATSKANTAQINATNAAKVYTDGQVSPLTTRITNAESSISQNAEDITLRATKTELNVLPYAQRNLAQRKDILAWNNFHTTVDMSEGVDAIEGEYYRYNYVYLNAKNLFPSIVFKENTRYSVSLRAVMESGNAPYITFHYTDGTNDLYVLNYGFSTPTTISYVTRENKTLSKISGTYNTGGYAKLFWINVVEGTRPVLTRNPAVEDAKVYAQAQFSVQADQISSKVSQTEFNNFSIGIKNFWLDSQLIEKVNTTVAWSISSRNLASFVENGTKMTIQFDIVSNDVFNLIIYKSPKNQIVWDGTSYTQISSHTVIATKTTIKATFTFDSSKPYIVLYKNSALLRSATITNLMLGLGDKVSWAPADEDIVTRTESAINQRAGSIELSVKSIGKRISNLTELLDRTGELVNKMIDVSGNEVTYANSNLSIVPIDVFPNETLIFRKTTSNLADNSFRCGFYDKDGNFISRYTNHLNESSKVVPDGSATLKVSYPKDCNPSVKSVLGGINDRLSSAELKITDDSIVSTVRGSTLYASDRSADLSTASNTAQSKIDAVVVGGVNYFLNGSLVRTGSVFCEIKTNYLTALIGKQVVISFEIKSSNSATYNVYPYQNNGVSIAGTRNITTTTTYKRVWFVDTIKDWGINNVNYTKGGIGFYNANGSGLSIRNVKIEVGNKPTDYTDAPQDIKTDYESKINVQKDRITLSSQKITQQLGGTITGADVSTINITPENISLKVRSSNDFISAVGVKLDGGSEMMSPYPNTFSSATPSSNNFSYANVKSNLPQGKTLKLIVGSSQVLAGTFTDYTIRLYDLNTNTGVSVLVTLPVSTTPQEWVFTTPSDGKYYEVLVYAGRSGATANNQIKVNNISIKEASQKDVTDWNLSLTKSGLLSTGIDIENKKIILTSDIVEFRSNTGGVTNKTKILIDGSIEAIDGKFTGTVTATSGRVGSLRISGSALTNEGFDDDAYIILRNDPHGTFVGIGGNVLPASSGLKAVGRFENKSVDGFFGSVNYSLLVEASGASRNVGIYCIGDLLLKGGALIAEKCYTDAGYTNSITLNIDKFSKYLFNPPMGSINTVYMPSGSQVLSAVGSVGLTGSNWCFDIGVSIHYSSSGGINLRGVSGGIIVNNNGDVVGHNDTYTYGGIQMKKGDHVTLRYFSTMSRWLIIDHQY